MNFRVEFQLLARGHRFVSYSAAAAVVPISLELETWDSVTDSVSSSDRHIVASHAAARCSAPLL